MVQKLNEPIEELGRVTNPVRSIYVQVLLFVLLVACVGLLITAMTFRDKLASVRTAGQDNLGWVVSQIEIDYLGVRLAARETLQAAESSEQSLTKSRLEELFLKFDIYYSRVDVFRRAISLVGETSDILSQYAEVRQDRDELAEMIDAMQDPDVQALKEFEVALIEKAPEVRAIAVDTLHLYQAATLKAREEETSLFYRFFFQSLVLSLLIAIGTYLVVRIWRELETKTRQTSNVAATLSKAFASTHNSVIVTDHQGIVRYCNKRTEDIFGWSTDEMIGQPISALIVPKHLRDQHDRGMARMAETGDYTLVGRGLVKIEALHKDGHTIQVELSLESDKDLDGTPIVLGFIRDISAQIAAEEQLRDALANARALAHEAEIHAAAKGTFLATMSHEMRTPLHGVIASLELIDEHVITGDNLRFLKTARDCGARALAQVNDILEFTRLGESRETPERFSPDDAVAGIIDELRPLARRRNNELVFELDGFRNISAVLGYPFAFSRAVYNLAGNAVKFTKDGTVTVKLNLRRTEGNALYLDVSIADTGIGIAPADQKRIFNKFETTAKGEISDVSGTGLGLPIAALAIEQMGGKIQLDSTVGFGSRFYFTIPLEEDTSVPVHITEQVAVNPTNNPALNVLVVDDNEVNVTLLTEMVKRLGHTATPAMNGQEAVELALGIRFDVILMDFSMPVMDGPEAAEHIRTGNGASRDAVIIGVTALIAAKDPSEAERVRHMEAVLIKPLGKAQLEEALRIHVAARREHLEHDWLGDAEFDEDDDDALDGSEIFDDVILGMGEETGFRLIKATLDDARLALQAMQETDGDLEDRARRIHLAVGSTGMTGMTVLSQTLSAAEVLALDGDDPSQTHLPEAASQELDRLNGIYKEMTRDFEVAG